MTHFCFDGEDRVECFCGESKDHPECFDDTVHYGTLPSPSATGANLATSRYRTSSDSGAS
jgi:hypothetical protein